MTRADLYDPEAHRRARQALLARVREGDFLVLVDKNQFLISKAVRRVTDGWVAGTDEIPLLVTVDDLVGVYATLNDALTIFGRSPKLDDVTD